MVASDLTLRLGTDADAYPTFEIFQKTIADFMRRTGTAAASGDTDPTAMAQTWELFRPLWDHLSRTGDRFWIAEQEGRAIGYARSILRGGVRELTEFWVLPGQQSAGVGRELLARAFPAEGAHHRVVIATSDPRALARYLKAGVYPYASTFSFTRIPEAVKVPKDLQVEPVADTPDTLRVLASIDREVLGHRRDMDHVWLMEQRTGVVYRRGGEVVGYGYLSKDWGGPFALLNEADFPGVLAHAETQSHALGAESLVFEVPLMNRGAIDHLLQRGYRLDGWVGSLMSDAPFGRFDRYICTSPPFFL